MEKLAKRIANRISSELNYSEERLEVIEYGLIALVQMVAVTFFVAVIGVIFGVAVEALIICFSVSLLRKYSGGAHVSSQEICTIIGVFTCILFSLISTYLLSSIVNTQLLLILIILIYLLSAFFIYKLAPVDNPNKPIKSEKKIKRMRKGSFTVLAVYFAISIALFLYAMRYNGLISISIALLFGILWQSFTLTKIGAATLKNIDLMLNKIFKIREEVNL